MAFDPMRKFASVMMVFFVAFKWYLLCHLRSLDDALSSLCLRMFCFPLQVLRKELKLRHHSRLDRLVCLLRATELVQALGQPSGGTFGGLLNMYLLRPLTKLMPNAIKKPIFDVVLNYSLGLPSPSRVIAITKNAKQK